MSYTYGPTSAVVECQDCDWRSESYKNAQAIAAKHAKTYGHMVIGNVVIAFSYDYRSEGPSRNTHEKREADPA